MIQTNSYFEQGSVSPHKTKGSRLPSPETSSKKEEKGPASQTGTPNINFFPNPQSILSQSNGAQENRKQKEIEEGFEEEVPMDQSVKKGYCPSHKEKKVNFNRQLPISSAWVSVSFTGDLLFVREKLKEVLLPMCFELCPSRPPNLPGLHSRWYVLRLSPAT